MTFRRRLLLIAATILLATAIEYGLMAAISTSTSVATGGTIIVQN